MAHHRRMFKIELSNSMRNPKPFHILFLLSCNKQVARLLKWDVPRRMNLAHGPITPEHTQSTLLEQQLYSTVRIFNSMPILQK